jgi:hypothetical protein
MIPPRNQLPKSWKGLKNFTFDLPLLVPNDPVSCPRTREEILEYLDVEAPGGAESGAENIVPFELKFIRTAQVNESKYWLWSFKGDEGLDCYVAVQQVHGQSILGFDETFGLTPEQWLVMDYYDHEGEAEWENEE